MSTATITLERPAAPLAPAEDLDARRALAFDAYHQITGLTAGLKKLLAAQGSTTGEIDEAQMQLGIVSRLELLSDIIFHAARLDGTDGSGWGEWDVLERLQRAFDGRLT